MNLSISSELKIYEKYEEKIDLKRKRKKKHKMEELLKEKKNQRVI